jgi:predicted  nucleic acid-binding Zn-ribbon protein
MAITRQLYQLQEIDIEIEQQEQALNTKTGQLGVRDILDDMQNRLSAGQQHLEELRHRHRDAEAEVDDVLSKIKTTEEQLYGGKVTNPKELSSLQHEVNTLREHNDQLETKALEIIEEVESAEKNVTSLTEEYQRLEEEWHQQQQQLKAEIEQLEQSLTELRQKRQQLTEQIEPAAVNLYEKIRQQKKPAVAKVEQGICHACRISLSASVLQKARSGQPVQCGTCGRILFIS